MNFLKLLFIFSFLFKFNNEFSMELKDFKEYENIFSKDKIGEINKMTNEKFHLMLLEGAFGLLLGPASVFLVQKILLKTKIIKNKTGWAHLSWGFPILFLLRNPILNVRDYNKFNDEFKENTTNSECFKKTFNVKELQKKKEEKKFKFIFHGASQNICCLKHFFYIKCDVVFGSCPRVIDGPKFNISDYGEIKFISGPYGEYREEYIDENGEYVYWGGKNNTWGDICQSIQKSSGEAFAKKLLKKLENENSKNIEQIDLIGHGEGGQVIVYALNYLMTTKDKYIENNKKKNNNTKTLIKRFENKKIKFNLALCATQLSSRTSQMLINFLEKYENSKLFYTHFTNDLIAAQALTNVIKIFEIGTRVSSFMLYDQKNFQKIKDRVLSIMFYNKGEINYIVKDLIGNTHNKYYFLKYIYPFLDEIEKGWDFFKNKKISFLVDC